MSPHKREMYPAVTRERPLIEIFPGIRLINQLQQINFTNTLNHLLSLAAIRPDILAKMRQYLGQWAPVG